MEQLIMSAIFKFRCFPFSIRFTMMTPSGLSEGLKHSRIHRMPLYITGKITVMMSTRPQSILIIIRFMMSKKRPCLSLSRAMGMK